MYSESALALERMHLWSSAVESVRPMTKAVLVALAGKAAAGNLRAAKMYFQIVWKDNPDRPLSILEGLSFAPALPVETPPNPQTEEEARIAQKLQAQTDKLRHIVPDTLQALADKAVAGNIKAIELYLKVVWNWVEPHRRNFKQTPFSSAAALDGAMRTMHWLVERANAVEVEAFYHPKGGEEMMNAWRKLLDVAAESNGLYTYAKVKLAELQAAQSFVNNRSDDAANQNLSPICVNTEEEKPAASPNPDCTESDDPSVLPSQTTTPTLYKNKTDNDNFNSISNIIPFDNNDGVLSNPISPSPYHDGGADAMRHAWRLGEETNPPDSLFSG